MDGTRRQEKFTSRLAGGHHPFTNRLHTGSDRDVARLFVRQPQWRPVS